MTELNEKPTVNDATEPAGPDLSSQQLDQTYAEAYAAGGEGKSKSAEAPSRPLACRPEQGPERWTRPSARRWIRSSAI